MIGADGAYSAVRTRLQRTDRFSYEQNFLEHGYKELTIPARADGSYAMEPHALHIWPRGGHMMIALPNTDGSFTCTLFWPFGGPVGFERVDTEREVHDTFLAQFPDAVELMPQLTDEYLRNSTSSLVTIRCGPWFFDDRIVLLGDAAHAVVPFYGQGANAALEDVTIFMELLASHDGEWAPTMAELLRTPQARYRRTGRSRARQLRRDARPGRVPVVPAEGPSRTTGSPMGTSVDHAALRNGHVLAHALRRSRRPRETPERRSSSACCSLSSPS